MQTVKNIIFDFGGVIYDIDYHKSIMEFNNLGAENFEMMYSQAIQNKLFEQLELGVLSPSSFREELKQYLKLGVTTLEMDNAWNALLIGFKKERLDLLMELSKNYNLYLLSNSNIIHYEVFLKEFQEFTRLNSFDDLFIKAHFSFDIKLRKPDLAAYEYVISKHQLNPMESLFIDDSIQNMRPAQSCGLKTYFLKKGEDMIDLFTDSQLKTDLKID